MSIAIAALVAAITVIFSLASMYTGNPAESLLNALLNFRQLPADTAMTALLYCAVIYAATFSGALFVLRVLGIFFAAVGIPNTEQLRRNREIARQNLVQVDLAKRQAKLLAHYMLRAQAMLPPQNPQPRPAKPRPRE
jgi:hypothetical protein